MKIPMLSIVIPVYNGASFLGQLLETLQNQTCKDFEVIFVDDGSTDGTGTCLRNAVKGLDFTVKMKQVENGGVSKARNIGMTLAEGEYLSFLDADDLISPNYVKMLSDALKEPSFDFMVFRSERTAKINSAPSETRLKPIRQITPDALLDLLAVNPTAFGVYNFFLRSAFLKTCGFRFAEGYKYYEDYDFMFRVAAKAEHILFTEQRLYYYLLQEGSAVATFAPERVNNIALMEQLVPYLEETVPAFVPEFQRHFLPRLYWSVMWQAALAFSFRNALRFAKRTGMREQMKQLTDCAMKKVALTAKLYLLCPPAFVLAARFAGRSRSKIRKTDYRAFVKKLNN